MKIRSLAMILHLHYLDDKPIHHLQYVFSDLYPTLFKCKQSTGGILNQSTGGNQLMVSRDCYRCAFLYHQFSLISECNGTNQNIIVNYIESRHILFIDTLGILAI